MPAVADRVAGKAVVMLDGGIRRGTDVMKAMALGAEFVFVGRPFLYAAAIGGAAGVSRAAEILKDELSRNMALLGVVRPNEIAMDLVVDNRCGKSIR